MRARNIILLSCIVLTLALSGFLAWYLIREDILSSSSGTASILDKFSPFGSTSSDHGISDPLTVLSETGPVSLAINKDTKEVVYYEKNTGKVTAVGFNGKGEHMISETILPRFISTRWSPTLKEVISTFGGKTTSLNHFSYTTKKATALGTGTEQAVFSPDGNQIGFVIKDGEHVSVSVGTLQHQKRLLQSRSKVTNLEWPKGEYLALTMESEDTTRALFTLSPQGELNRITEFVLDLRSRWSQDGNRVLVSSYTSEGTLELWRYDLANHTQQLLASGIRATDCVENIDGSYVICGIDDQEAFEPGDITSQRIEQISLPSLHRSVIMPSSQRKIAVQEILLTPVEDYLIFVNGFDRKAYSLKLDN